jgi:septal ring factor EnvC (AmiA/AmiB activator)
MSSVRERPRLVAVRLLGLAVLVGIGVAIGAVADDDSAEVPAQVQAKLNRAETVSARRADRLARIADELERVRTDLNQATVRSQQLARTNSRLRGDLRRANRTKQPRGSRSR